MGLAVVFTVAMTETADRYRQLADRFTALVGDVPTEGWDATTPCEGWTARDVLDHLIQGSCNQLENLGRAPEVPDGDPPARWAAVRDAMQSAIDDPEVASTEYDGPFGRTTLADAFDGFMSADLMVHTWDIARATGLAQYEPMPAEEIERVHGRLAPLGDAIRRPGVFGAAVAVPDDASAQDRFLGFIGRQP